MNRSICYLLLLIASAALAQPNADTVWTRTYGNPIANDATSGGIALRSGGFLLYGQTEFSFSGDGKAYAVRLNEVGDTLWTLTYPEEGTGVFYGACEAVGGFLLTGIQATGTSIGRLLLIRVDFTGNVFWSWDEGGEYSSGMAVSELPIGLIAIAGYQSGYPSLIFLEPESGDTTMVSDFFTGWWYSMDAAVDGVVLGGIADGFAGPMMLYRKYGFNGDLIWEGLIAHTGSDEIRSIVALDDGGAIAVGCIRCFSDNPDSYLLQIDETGELTLEENIGDPDLSDVMNHVSLTPTGSCLMTGMIQTAGQPIDIYSKIYDPELGMVWEGIYGGAESDETGTWGFFRDDGRIYLAGNSSLSDEFLSDMYFVVIDTGMVSGTEKSSPEIPRELNLTAYPNPFNASAHLSFSLPHSSFVNVIVYDMLGREVAMLANQEFPAGNHIVSFDGTNLATGVYTANVTVDGEISTTRLVLLK